MVKKHNKALGVAREGRLIDRLWDNGFVLIHAPRSAGGYPKRIFREKYPDIFKANKDKPIKPIDFAAMKKGKTYLFQVSKYKAHISNWEILVLTDLANQVGAIPILGWIENKRWKLIHAVTKSELMPFENEYERFCEIEGLVP